MIFGERVWSFVGVGRNALSSGDVDKCAVARCVRPFRHLTDCLQLFLRVEKALVAARYIVVDLDAKHAVFLRTSDDPVCIIAL